MDTLVKILDVSQLLSVIKRITEGQMAITLLVDVQWGDSEHGRAYMKIFPKQHPLGVLNEVTGFILAHYSGLPLSAKAGLMKVPTNVFDNGDADSNGFYDIAFVCSEVPGQTPNSMYNIGEMVTVAQLSPVVDLIKSWKYLPGCAAFDDWTANTDRHLGNVVFSGPGDIYMIDHSNLPISPCWAASELEVDKDFDNKLLQLIGFANKEALPKKSEVLLAFKGHKVAFSNAFSELNYWWNLFLKNDKQRLDALNLFIEHRSSNRHDAWCSSIGQLGI